MIELVLFLALGAVLIVGLFFFMWLDLAKGIFGREDENDS